jgi:beta-lactamase class A
MMRTKIACGIGAAALVLASLTGCSFSASAGSKTISQSELETKSKAALQPQVQVTLNQLKCKGGLEAKAGATQECAIEFDGKWQLVAVNATDDKGNFHVKTVPGIVPQPEWAS